MFPDSDKGKEKRLKSAAGSLGCILDLSRHVNSCGHPTTETLSKLIRQDVEIFRTDMQGDIVCVSDGKKISFVTEKKASTDKLRTTGDGEVLDAYGKITKQVISFVQDALLLKKEEYVILGLLKKYIWKDVEKWIYHIYYFCRTCVRQQMEY